MADMKQVIAEFRKFTWDCVKLTSKKYGGAIKCYPDIEGEPVAIFFSASNAWVIEDDEGLFSAVDLESAIINGDIELCDLCDVEGAIKIAELGGNDDDSNFFNTDKLLALGIDEDVIDSVRADIEARLAVVEGFGVETIKSL